MSRLSHAFKTFQKSVKLLKNESDPGGGGYGGLHRFRVQFRLQDSMTSAIRFGALWQLSTDLWEPAGSIKVMQWELIGREEEIIDVGALHVITKRPFCVCGLQADHTGSVWFTRCARRVCVVNQTRWSTAWAAFGRSLSQTSYQPDRRMIVRVPNSMEQGPSWEAKSRTASQKSPHLAFSFKV